MKKIVFIKCRVDILVTLICTGCYNLYIGSLIFCVCVCVIANIKIRAESHIPVTICNTKIFPETLYGLCKACKG